MDVDGSRTEDRKPHGRAQRELRKYPATKVLSCTCARRRMRPECMPLEPLESSPQPQCDLEKFPCRLDQRRALATWTANEHGVGQTRRHRFAYEESRCRLIGGPIRQEDPTGPRSHFDVNSSDEYAESPNCGPHR